MKYFLRDDLHTYSTQSDEMESINFNGRRQTKHARLEVLHPKVQIRFKMIYTWARSKT